MCALKNNQVIDINLKQQRTYEMKLAVKNSFLAEWEECFFTLIERYSNEQLILPAVTDHEEDDITVFNITLSFNDYVQTFMEYSIWDLYVNGQDENDKRRVRAKSKSSLHRFLAIDLPESGQMFYPYATKKGKLSFQRRDYFLYAEIDDVNLTKRGFSFSGYFNYLPLFISEDSYIDQLQLIAVNNRDEQKINIPLERQKRTKIYEKIGGNEELLYCGFEGSFDFSPFLHYKDKVFLKFYLSMTLQTPEGKETLRSLRVRIDTNTAVMPKRIIRSVDGMKKKIWLKPTRKSKYASLQVARFYRKQEIVNNMKSTWVKIRRSKLLKSWYKTAFALISRLPVKKKVIMFESFLGKQYSDSPRAIYEYMLENYPDYDMYWSVDRRSMALFQNKNVRHVRRFSVKWLFLMARARFWISNSRLPLWIPKPNHTTYLQTWHGTPLKRLAVDMDEVHMPGTNAEKYKRNFLKATAKWDYLVSPNAYSSHIFRRAFQFDRTILETGYPRNDFLINANNEENITELKQKIGIPESKRVILYAPTWRDNQYYERGKYKFNLELDLDRLYEEFGDDTIILLRLHYLIAENINLAGYEYFVYDVSDHEVIRELYLVSDMLITDYSSVFFDYANLKRPMLFFVYDIDEYRDSLRGFYFDLESKAPGPLVKTTEALIENIKSIDQHGFEPSEETLAFYDRFCYLEDGRASEQVVKELFTHEQEGR